MKYVAVVRTSFVGFHNWPEAPEGVMFLRDKHRHVFHVELAVSQTHSDRDVEFTLLKQDLDRIIMSRFCNGGHVGRLGAKSCEMIAETIIEWAEMSEYAVVHCSVFEDNENGAIVYPEGRLEHLNVPDGEE